MLAWTIDILDIVIDAFVCKKRITEWLNPGTVNSILIFTEVSCWHVEVISVSYTYIMSTEVIWNVSMLSTTNTNNESKNSPASGRIPHFLNNSL
jgi:hypothetical protein